MTLEIATLRITIKRTKFSTLFCLVSLMLIVTIKTINAECCYPERPNAEGRDTDCSDTDCSYTECPLVECRCGESHNKCLNAMCRFVEYRFDKCHGAT